MAVHYLWDDMDAIAPRHTDMTLVGRKSNAGLDAAAII